VNCLRQAFAGSVLTKLDEIHEVLVSIDIHGEQGVLESILEELRETNRSISSLEDDVDLIQKDVSNIQIRMESDDTV